MLNLDDEQLMKLEKALKDSVLNLSVGFGAQLIELNEAAFVPVHLALPENQKALAKVAELLTEEQKRMLRTWIGVPLALLITMHSPIV